MNIFISPIIDLEEAKEFQEYILGYGHFNSIHPGHLRYLKHAKEINNKLVIAIQKDFNFTGNNYSQIERAESIAQLGIADAVILLPDNELAKAVGIIQPKQVILGKEYESAKTKDIEETKKILNSLKKRIIFHAGEINYFIPDLLKESESKLEAKRYSQFKKALERQKITIPGLIRTAKKLKKSKLIVIGDSIVDEYSACEALGMSAEAPVIVVKEIDQEKFIGGAAIVATHIASLGSESNFISIIGNDEEGRWLKNELNNNNVSSKLFTDKNRKTTFKKRYVVENQKLFRVSRLDDHYISERITNQIIKYLNNFSKEINGIIISDFVYGLVTEELIKGVTNFAKKNKIKLFGDCQSSSQIGDISRMKEFFLLSPNEKEARLSIKNREISLNELSLDLIRKTDCKNLIMKLGADGFIVYESNKLGTQNIQAFPALSVNPIDVAGAGDTLLSIMAAGLSNNAPIMEVAALACCGASIAVNRMGNVPVNAEDIIEKLNLIDNAILN